MPFTIKAWDWEDAFSKFGFEDGDGWNGTHIVAEFIEKLGYTTDCDHWGCHNYMIMDIQKDGVSLMDEEKIKVGYDEPHTYLPAGLVAALNKEFPSGYDPDEETRALVKRLDPIFKFFHRHDGFV